MLIARGLKLKIAQDVSEALRAVYVDVVDGRMDGRPVTVPGEVEIEARRGPSDVCDTARIRLNRMGSDQRNHQTSAGVAAGHSTSRHARVWCQVRNAEVLIDAVADPLDWAR